MVSEFSFHENNGASPGTLGSIINLNMGSVDQKNLSPASNPVFAGGNSFEKWFAGSWAGTFTKIDNVKFWMSAGSYGTGESIVWNGSQTLYVTPTSDESTVAVSAVPSSEPVAANVSLGSSLSGELNVVGRSDWIVLQHQTTASANPGPTNIKQFTIQWDEQ